MPHRVRDFPKLRLPVSQPSQLKGDSRRLQWAHDICQANNWSLDNSLTFQDLGVSAFRSKNSKFGELAAFRELIRVGRVTPGSILRIENIERLSRDDVAEAGDLFRSIIKAGVWIATREPPRVYHKENSGNFMNMLEPLFIMARAHEESQRKSMRLREVWGKKKQQATESLKPLSRSCPGWIELTAEGYRVIPERRGQHAP